MVAFKRNGIISTHRDGVSTHRDIARTNEFRYKIWFKYVALRVATSWDLPNVVCSRPPIHLPRSDFFVFSNPLIIGDKGISETQQQQSLWASIKKHWWWIFEARIKKKKRETLTEEEKSYKGIPIKKFFTGWFGACGRRKKITYFKSNTVVHCTQNFHFLSLWTRKSAVGELSLQRNPRRWTTVSSLTPRV